ncbi:MAG: hypothetical protein ABIB71_06085 [Candidatus Woesearchaeota archaeon]
MRIVVIFLCIVLLLTAGCSEEPVKQAVEEIDYNTFTDGNFYASYPDWENLAGGADVDGIQRLVFVKKDGCNAGISTFEGEASDFYSALLGSLDSRGVSYTKDEASMGVTYSGTADSSMLQMALRVIGCNNRSYLINTACEQESYGWGREAMAHALYKAYCAEIKDAEVLEQGGFSLAYPAGWKHMSDSGLLDISDDICRLMLQNYSVADNQLLFSIRESVISKGGRILREDFNAGFMEYESKVQKTKFLNRLRVLGCGNSSYSVIMSCIENGEEDSGTVAAIINSASC